MHMQNLALKWIFMTIWRISVERDSKNKIWKWAHQFMVDRFQLNKRIFFKVSKIAGFKRETFKTDYRTELGKVSPHGISLIKNRISLQGSKYKIMISGWKYFFFQHARNIAFKWVQIWMAFSIIVRPLCQENYLTFRPLGAAGCQIHSQTKGWDSIPSLKPLMDSSLSN